MSVLHFLLLTLFFLNLYTSILIILTCRYVVSTDATDFLRKAAKLSLKGPYMATVYHPDGNMVCQRGKSNFISKMKPIYNFYPFYTLVSRTQMFTFIPWILNVQFLSLTFNNYEVLIDFTSWLLEHDLSRFMDRRCDHFERRLFIARKSVFASTLLGRHEFYWSRLWWYNRAKHDAYAFVYLLERARGVVFWVTFSSYIFCFINNYGCAVHETHLMSFSNRI